MKKHTNPKGQWHIPPMNWWKTTTSLEEAIVQYIGEVEIIPKVSYNSFIVGMGFAPIKPITVFYYGTPNVYLQRKFGYIRGKIPDTNKTNISWALGRKDDSKSS